MELISNLALGFETALTLQNILCCFIGVLVGTLLFLRRPSRFYPAVATGLSMVTVFTAMVWLQMNGTLTSNYLAVVLGVLGGLRLFFNYWVGLATSLTALVLLVLFMTLEAKGILPVASLYVLPPVGAVASPSYQANSFQVILSVLLLGFLSSKSR